MIWAKGHGLLLHETVSTLGSLGNQRPLLWAAGVGNKTKTLLLVFQILVHITELINIADICVFFEFFFFINRLRMRRDLMLFIEYIDSITIETVLVAAIAALVLIGAFTFPILRR